MRLSLLSSLFLGLCLSSPLATAGMIQPGLWEISSSAVQVDGQAQPGMQQMLEQMKNMPPEQRQIMEQMLAKQGVQLGDKGVRICISEAQIAAQELPLQDQKSGCSHEVTERTATRWKFRFTCPDSQGEGETRFLGEKEFTSQVRATRAGQSTRMESHARWVAADCAALPPR